jgi:hypothetical protein
VIWGREQALLLRAISRGRKGAICSGACSSIEEKAVCKSTRLYFHLQKPKRQSFQGNLLISSEVFLLKE